MSQWRTNRRTGKRFMRNKPDEDKIQILVFRKILPGYTALPKKEQKRIAVTVLDIFEDKSLTPTQRAEKIVEVVQTEVSK